MKQYQKVKVLIINSTYPLVRAFSMRNELKLTKTKTHVVQYQIYNANEMHTKADKRAKNNIRRYYVY